MSHAPASATFSRVPVIDVGALVWREAAERDVARAIDAACRTSGFFYVVNHGVESGLQARLRTLADGLLTMLAQDDVGGLQVRSESHWIDAPPVAGSFVCNLGDMLEKMTGGHYRSTPHREGHLAQFPQALNAPARIPR